MTIETKYTVGAHQDVAAASARGTTRSRRRFLGELGGYGLLAAAAEVGLGRRREALAAGIDGSHRIDSVEAFPVRLWTRPTPGPPAFASDHDPRRWRWSGPFAQLDGAIVVVVKTDQGATGFGLGCGGAAAATIVRGHLRHLVLGTDPTDVELHWDQMYASGLAYGRRGVFVMALSGVDNALWDLTGKIAGRPVHRLLGGATKEKAPAYFTAFEPERGLDLGFRNFKLPMRNGLRDGAEGMQRIVEEVRRARATVGDEALLMIDCGMQWNDVAYTLEMARRLAQSRLHFIEEPLSPDEVLGYAELVRSIDGPLIASGEHEYTQHGFRMLFHHRAVEVVQPDVSWCGGVTALRRIAALCDEHGLAFVPHRGGSRFGLPLVLWAPGAPMAESFGTGDPATDLMLAMSSRYRDGAYWPDEAPGFGTELTEPLVRAHLQPEV